MTTTAPYCYGVLAPAIVVKGITDIGIHYIDLSLTVSDTSSQCEQFHNNKICSEYSIFGYFCKHTRLKKLGKAFQRIEIIFILLFLIEELLLTVSSYPIDIIISYRMK